jgi:hypothetical protein
MVEIKTLDGREATQFKPGMKRPSGAGRKKAAPLTVAELLSQADYVVKHGRYPGKRGEKGKPVSDATRARLHLQLLQERQKPGATQQTDAGAEREQAYRDISELMQIPEWAAAAQTVSIALTEIRHRREHPEEYNPDGSRKRAPRQDDGTANQ